MSDLPTTHFVESAAGRVAYHEMGQGPAVVLIHGGGPGAYGYSNYRRNFEALAHKGLRVIVLDMPGFGQSDYRPNVGSLFDAPAAAVREIADHLEIEKLSLVGNSLGGGAALRFALDNPDRADKLVLMGPGGSLAATSPFPTEGLLRMVMFYEGDGPSIDKLERIIDLLVFDRSSFTRALVEERYETATLPHTLANPPLRGQVQNPRNELWREPLDTLQHKTLLIWGKDDRVIPLDMAFILLKRIANSSLHVFPKCGHWAQWEKADEFNALVADFLGRD